VVVGAPARPLNVDPLVGGTFCVWNAIWFILGSLLLLVLLANWCGMIGYAINRYRHPEKTGGFSFAPPLIGGILGCVVCVVSPLETMRSFAWVALLLDPSILLLSIALILHPISRLFGFPSPFGGRRDSN
jgi:hypothetical protein